MRGVLFEVKGKLAHFRKPDTTSTQMTYPFITPTAVKGMVGAILGIEDFVTKDKIGVQILNPVKTVAQQLSMLGNDGGTMFNRPTSIELIINPAYRIYYAGEENVDLLITSLEKNHSVYHTYLGAAYALTTPLLIETYQDVKPVDWVDNYLETKAVVPTVLIKELQLSNKHHFCRAGGFLYEYKGNRTFDKSIDFIYEQEGKVISFLPSNGSVEIDAKIASFQGEVVCLF